MKKLLFALTLMLALLATCLIGCEVAPDKSNDDNNSEVEVLKANAAAVFTLDVNPGVRIYVKEDNTVIAVEATNEDGEEVVSELELEGINYETVVEEIIDKMDEKGYLEGEESSVLISVEKKAMDLSEKLNEKINKTFEKHGKKASVIEQELDVLDEDIGKAIGDMAKKYNISEGKAHLIEKIREEFPELSEEELAGLKVNDLGMMLEETSDDIKEQFKKVGKAVDEDYVGREAALTIALESLEIIVEDVEMARVFVTRDEGKMVYEVEFVYNGMEYEITVDAENGTILATSSEEFVEFDAKEMIDEFCDKNNINPDEIKNQIINGIFGNGENGGKHDGNEEKTNEKPLTKGELLKGILAELELYEETLKKTDVRVYETESGTVFSVMIENNTGDVYRLVVEAYSGTIIKAELNGTEIELSTQASE